MRALQIIPILHTDQDLGQLAEAVRQATIASQGLSAWTAKQQVIKVWWLRIAVFVAQLPPVLTNFRVYQDALPICLQEEKIVADLAKNGSINHRLLQNLRERGAHIMGTESPELMLQEYQLAHDLVRGAPAAPADPALLLERRDRFIASRIDETLKLQEKGLLFIGLLHRVERFLPPDITVGYPCGRGRSDADSAA